MAAQPNQIDFSKPPILWGDASAPTPDLSIAVYEDGSVYLVTKLNDHHFLREQLWSAPAVCRQENPKLEVSIPVWEIKTRSLQGIQTYYMPILAAQPEGHGQAVRRLVLHKAITRPPEGEELDLASRNRLFAAVVNQRRQQGSGPSISNEIKWYELKTKPNSAWLRNDVNRPIAHQGGN